MRVEGRRYRDEWIPNFYPARIVGEARIRVSRTGRFILLTAEEDAQTSFAFGNRRYQDGCNQWA